MEQFVIGFACAIGWVFPVAAFYLVRNAFGTSIKFGD